jgi:hypothetical protein
MPDTYLPASKRRIFGGEKRRHPVAQTLRDIAHGMNATANQATLRKAAELIDRMTNAEAQPGAVLRELVALKDLQERLLSLHEMGHGTDYGDFHKRNREAWAEASAFAASGQCRSDGRCQYAIDHGAEGMGHCPQGKCCMLLPEPAYKHIDGDTNDADLLWAEIHHLRAALQGPAGFATWQDAATDERIRRIKAERLAAPSVPPVGVGREAERKELVPIRPQSTPCGECHLQAGEKCDICGARSQS